MNAPKKLSIVLAVAGLAAAGGSQAVRTLYPPLRAVSNPALDALRAQHAQLDTFSSDRVEKIDTAVAELHRQLWTPETFALWQKNNIPDGWSVQDLGRTDAKQVQGRRYAFQRPNATDQEWNEILGVIKGLEDAHCVSVQSVALAVRPGYAGSRQFSQCVIIAIFYFLPKA